MQKETIFFKKNFLIYGFGKSGFASYKFLRKKNDCKIIDDNRKNIPIKYKHKTIRCRFNLKKCFYCSINKFTNQNSAYD